MNFNDIPYQLAARSLIIDGLRVAYVDTNPGALLVHGDTGTGPVVLLHGVGATLDWFSEVTTRVAPARRVLALDLIGFGKSDKPALEDAVPFYVDLLKRFFDELGVTQVTLVGHSMGATVAAHFALAQPTMVDRLVLAAPPGIRPVPPDRRAGVRAGWSRQTLSSMSEAGWREWYQKRVYRWSDKLEDVWRLQCELAKGVRFREWAQACEAAVTSILNNPLGDRLRQIAVPTLVIWGAEDPVVPIEIGEEIAALVPGARLVTLNDCGHYPMFERPNAFVDEILAFVAPDAAGGSQAAHPSRLVGDVKPWPAMAPEIGRLARVLFDVRLQCVRLAAALSIDELAWKPSAGTDSVGALLLRLGGTVAWYHHEMLRGEPLPAELAERYCIEGGLDAPPRAPRQSAGQLLAGVEKAHAGLAEWLVGREDEQLDRVFTHRETSQAATLRSILWTIVEDALHRRGQIACVRQQALDRKANGRGA